MNIFYYGYLYIPSISFELLCRARWRTPLYHKLRRWFAEAIIARSPSSAGSALASQLAILITSLPGQVCMNWWGGGSAFIVVAASCIVGFAFSRKSVTGRRTNRTAWAWLHDNRLTTAKYANWLTGGDVRISDCLEERMYENGDKWILKRQNTGGNKVWEMLNDGVNISLVVIVVVCKSNEHKNG
jgi:hypothetical protein